MHTPEFDEIVNARLKEIHQERFGIWEGDILLYERLLFMIGLAFRNTGQLLMLKFGPARVHSDKEGIEIRPNTIQKSFELPRHSLN